MSTESQLLQVWERGYASPTIERVLLMSALAQPVATIDQILDFPIGLRDARLMELRCQLFGSEVTSTISCCSCEARLELSFDLNAVLAVEKTVVSKTFALDWHEWSLQIRCPSTRDLIAEQPSTNTIITKLVQSCVLHLSPDLIEEACQAADFQLAFTECLQRHDPLGLIEFHMSCSECQSEFDTTFDIGRFLWTEIDARCQKLMSDIHLLACAYGWTEAAILMLGPWRREVYLNMVRN